MRVLLIYCPPSEIDDQEMRILPMGLVWLQANLQKAGHECVVLNLALPGADSLESAAESVEPDLIGFTVLSVNRFEVHRAVQLIRRILPGAIVVLGGPHVSGDYDFMASAEEWALVDYFFVGPSEMTLIEALEKIKHGQRADIHRVIHGCFERNDLVSPPEMGIPCENVVTSAGCPGSCIFCASRRIWGGFYIRRRPEEVVAEINALWNMGIKRIVFSDDTFTYDMSNLAAILDSLAERGMKISWDARTRADAISVDDVRYMRSMGCASLSFGIETASQQLQVKIGKNIDLERAASVVRASAEAGIFTNIFFVIGVPGETSQTIDLDMNFISATRPDSVTTHILHFLPGTPLEKIYGRRDWSIQGHRTHYFTEEQKIETLLNWQKRVDEAGRRQIRKRSIEDFKTLCGTFSGQYDLQAGLGDLLMERGETSQALKVYKASLSSLPTPEVRIRMAEARLTIGNAGKAMEQISQATDELGHLWSMGVKINSKTAFLLGYCRELAQDYSEALKWYCRALELDKGTPEAHCRAAWICLQLDMDREAVRHLLGAPMDMRDAEWYENMCSALLNQGKSKEAADWLKDGIRKFRVHRGLVEIAAMTGLKITENPAGQRKNGSAGRRNFRKRRK